MKRRLFNAGAVVSLVLCVGMNCLWLRSLKRNDVIQRHDESGFLRAESTDGWVLVSTQTQWGLHAVQREPRWSFFSLHEPGSIVRGYGLSSLFDPRPAFPVPWKWNSPALNFGLWRFAIAYWFLVLASAILPVTWMLCRLKRRRTGHCPACGYDLRGTLSGSGSECPECGAAPGTRRDARG